MKILAHLLLILTAAISVTATGKKPAPLRPARPAVEAASAFYPEIQKHADFYQRWAATASGAELDTCRKHYRQAILDAFGDFAVQRRWEFAQTRWPQLYTVRCKGRQGTVITCTEVLTAPLGQEFDTASVKAIGRAFTQPPRPSSDRRRLDVVLKKKGEGTVRMRLAVHTRRTVEDIERELDRELAKIREKLERHGLPSDATIEKYRL